MSTDLLQKVQEKLAPMTSAELRLMADSVGSVSFSLLSQLRRKKYGSRIAYERLVACLAYLDRDESGARPGEGAAPGVPSAIQFDED